MTQIEKSSTAHLDRGKDHFEILVDCEKAIEFKKGGSVSLNDVVVTNIIFKDVKKGDKASEHELEKVFKTTDVMKISEMIIKQGEIQLTTQYKNKIRDDLKKRIINIVHRNAVDPQTKKPHPPERISRAMEEAKINIDDHKTAEQQIDDIIKQLRTILPISFEKKKVQVIIPAKYTSQCFHIIKSYGTLIKDEWQNDGSLLATNEMPAGLVDDFFSQLNKLAHGEVESKILKE